MLDWASSQHYMSLERDENSLVFLIFRYSIEFRFSPQNVLDKEI